METWKLENFPASAAARVMLPVFDNHPAENVRIGETRSWSEEL
jgi:hypothetical protein